MISLNGNANGNGTANGTKRGLLRERLDWLRGWRMPQAEGTLTPIPPVPDGYQEISMRAVVENVAYARILYRPETCLYRYEVIEPPLGKTERDALGFVREMLVRSLDLDLEVLSEEGSKHNQDHLEQIIDDVFRYYRVRLDSLGARRVKYYLIRDTLGYGFIDVPMRDPDIEDISCDGADVPLFVFTRKYESMETTLHLPKQEDVDNFVINLGQRCGRQISLASPMLDGTLPDGSRLQATLGHEVSDNGSTFTIRRFRAQPFTPIDLIKLGTVSAEVLAYFWILVQHGANIMLTGGTASGKTTALNALGVFIPQQSKIVSIEDTRELNLPHQNWVKSVTRANTGPANEGEIEMFDLLKAALRQRPEYLLVGEVRGPEAMVAFQAMATGHIVFATMHADSARSAVYRLENDPIKIPRIVLQSLDVVAVQVQARVQGKRVRRMREVVELVGVDPQTRELYTHTPFHWDSINDRFIYGGKSPVLDKIAGRNNWKFPQLMEEWQRRTRLLEVLAQRPELTYEDIGRIVMNYYARPDQVALEFGIHLVEVKR